MNVIIAGSRTLTDFMQVVKAINSAPFEVEKIITGGCPTGADRIAGLYAALYGIPVEVFPADWKAHGRAAGPIRNRQMAEVGDALIAVWNGKSRGTANMIQEARSHGLLVHVHLYQPRKDA